MKTTQIVQSLYLVGVVFLSFIVLEIATNLFQASPQTKQFIMFVGILLSVNLSVMVEFIRKYRKERI